MAQCEEPLDGSFWVSRDLKAQLWESGWLDRLLLCCWWVTSVRYEWGWSWGRPVQKAMGKIEGVVGRAPFMSCVLCTALCFFQCVSVYISTNISIYNQAAILQYSAPEKTIVLISCPLCLFSPSTVSLSSMVNNKMTNTYKWRNIYENQNNKK